MVSDGITEFIIFGVIFHGKFQWVSKVLGGDQGGMGTSTFSSAKGFSWFSLSVVEYVYWGEMVGCEFKKFWGISGLRVVGI